MTLDAFATERHFLDHLLPVWRLLPERGSFYIARELRGHAAERGLEAIPVGSPFGTDPLPPGGDGPTLVAGYGDIRRARAAGRARFAFLEHGAGQSYGADPKLARHHSYAGGEDRDDVGLFLVPNEHAAGRWREAYPAAVVAVVGSPVLDDLPRRASPADPPLVAIGFHWDCSLGSETGSAIHEYSAILRELGRTFAMIGTGHPRRRDLAARYRHAGIEFVPSWSEVCSRASVYVCDNSSTLFEFAATGRAVAVMNSRHYRRDREHGLRFWGAASVGPQADRPRDLVGAIRLALEDPADVRAAREAAVERVYQPRSGGARLAAAALVRWLRSG